MEEVFKLAVKLGSLFIGIHGLDGVIDDAILEDGVNALEAAHIGARGLQVANMARDAVASVASAVRAAFSDNNWEDVRWLDPTVIKKVGETTPAPCNCLEIVVAESEEPIPKDPYEWVLVTRYAFHVKGTEIPEGTLCRLIPLQLVQND